MKLTRIFSAGAAVAAILSLSSCKGGNSADVNNADSREASEAVGSRADADIPAVTVIDADGQIPSSEGKLMVLDFNATWCGPCRQFAPNFESVAEKYRGKASFFSIDVDRNPGLAARFGIESIPTVIYIQPDGTTSSTMGYMDEAVFDSAVAARLNAE